jgi:hypothetical protein
VKPGSAIPTATSCVSIRTPRPRRRINEGRHRLFGSVEAAVALLGEGPVRCAIELKVSAASALVRRARFRSHAEAVWRPRLR